MIKICIVVNSLMFGGVEKVIENYYSDYDKSEYEITVVAQDNSVKGNIDHFEKMGMRVIIIPHKRKHLFKNFFAIKKILKCERFDVVHSNMSFTNCYVLRFAKKYGVRIRINHYHNVFKFCGIKAKLVNYCNRLCDKYSTHNFFCSEAVKAYFGKTDHDSIILKNAFCLEDFLFSAIERNIVREEYAIDDGTLLIGQIGRLTSQKNQRFTLDIFKKICEKRSDVRLMFIGDGEDKEMLRKYAKDLCIADKLIFVAGRPDIHQFYSAFDVVVLPSMYEGLGIVAVEAALSGVFVLLSEAFPDEIFISGNLHKFPLESSYWIQQIENFNAVGERYPIALAEFVNCGYDISKEKLKLFELYKTNLYR